MSEAATEERPAGPAPAGDSYAVLAAAVVKIARELGDLREVAQMLGNGMGALSQIHSTLTDIKGALRNGNDYGSGSLVQSLEEINDSLKLLAEAQTRTPTIVP